ncbi:hypothetical protein [Flavobacterium sp. HJSW_4]|uniref:hypothetical protein n=1 Tax=Flavobacterium sp. HJSW_4 TaxID=3344660 RepID=UPI0035F2A536
MTTFFVRADRKMFKVYFSNILYIEDLKDDVVIYVENKKVINLMNIKIIHNCEGQQIIKMATSKIQTQIMDEWCLPNFKVKFVNSKQKQLIDLKKEKPLFS